MSTAVFYSGHPDVPSNGRAGYATHIRGMIAGMTQCGVHVEKVIQGDAGGVLKNEVPVSELRSLRSNIRRLLPTAVWNTVRDVRLLVADRRGAARLARVLDESDFEFVYERHAHLHRGAVAVARSRGVRHVLEVNSPPGERADLGGKSGLDRHGRNVALEVVEQADVAVFVSTALRRHYEQLLGFQLSNAIVVPNAVMAADHAQPDEERNADASHKSVTIGFVGSLLRWHGVDVLLNAFVDVHRDRPNTKLIIVGDGELRGELEALTADLGLTDAVDFVGAVAHEAALRYVASFDIGVMVQSNWYGSPVKLFEYGAYGCAILAPDVAPAHEVLLDGVEALFTAPTVNDIAAALMRLIDDEPFRVALGAAARTRVLSQYTWGQAAASVLDAISAVETAP